MILLCLLPGLCRVRFGPSVVWRFPDQTKAKTLYIVIQSNMHVAPYLEYEARQKFVVPIAGGIRIADANFIVKLKQAIQNGLRRDQSDSIEGIRKPLLRLVAVYAMNSRLGKR